MTTGVFVFTNSYAAAAGNSEMNGNSNYWKISINSSGNKGWFKHNTKWYYFNDKGDMDKGWILHNGKWYFLNTGGDMQTGWLLHNGKWYFMSDEGDMKTGWVKNSNKWYYLNKDGDLSEGCWIFYNSKWYYLGNNGEMLVSTTTPDGYEVGADGSWTGKSYKTTAPTGVTATAVSTSSIELNWNEIVGADYYYVYYRTSTEGSYTSVKKTTNSFTLTGLDSGTKVYFKIEAVNGDLVSPFSSTVYATTN